MTRFGRLIEGRARPAVLVALVLASSLVVTGPSADAAAPPAPTDVVVGASWHSDGADVSWTPPLLAAAWPISRYVVDVSTDGGATWTPAG